MLQDIRLAIRLLLKNRGFTAIVLATLGLAVAANTVVFSIVHAILFRPLPFPEPERLLQVNTESPFEEPGDWGLSWFEYADVRTHARTLESVGAWDIGDANLTAGERSVVVTAAKVTSTFLPTLGVRPMFGRLFDAGEDVPGDPTVTTFGYGGAHAVVLGYGIFQTAFGGDPSVVGRTVKIDALPVTVVGVMPRDFAFPERAQIWMPLAADPAKMQRAIHRLNVIGRLAPGAGIESARSEMAALMPVWAHEHPGEHQVDPVEHPIVFRHLQEQVTGPVRRALLTLQAAVAFVLLIACANISNLLLARTEARSAEIVVRSALGASRRRLARQFLTESLVLGVLGAVIGILCAMWALDLVVGFLPEGLPRAHEIRLDTTVLIYALTVAVGTSVVFGLTPIVHASGNLAGALRAAGQRTTSGRSHRLFRRVLIFAQVALAIDLVLGAGLMVRSLVRLQKSELGFDPRGLVTLTLQLPKKAYPTDDDVMAFWKRLQEGARSLPGVQSATLMDGLPPQRLPNSNSFQIVGRVAPAGREWIADSRQFAGDDYFSTMRIPLLRGRIFYDTDTETAPRVAIINEAMAKKYWADEDPIGKRIGFFSTSPPGEPPIEQTIVGVVADVKQHGVELPAGTELYLPLRQTLGWHHYVPGETFVRRTLHLVLRTDGDPRALLGTVRAYIASQDPDLPVARLQTMDHVVYETIAKPRFLTTLLACFAGVALMMAAIGIYGVMSYSVAQRTKELSIRMALGANAERLQRMLVLEGLQLAGTGVAVGLALAGLTTLAFRPWVSALLFEISGLDPATYAVVVAVTGCIAALASYLPARRATRIHPMTAMRHE
ncbi:ABC transporter permease [Pendulispora brunnea]|uniref:ABC transporter permease n=1 Tax=Pendulispora brunnea TaxID=2905690 RepID=A0ABZ2JV35_9BACT